MKLIVEQAVNLLNIWIERFIEFRCQQLPFKDVFDIQYEDLMKDPILTVRRIYDHFDFLKWSDKLEKAMDIWLINNPQEKRNHHSYSLEEFGLPKIDTNEIHKKYEMFCFVSIYNLMEENSFSSS